MNKNILRLAVVGIAAGLCLSAKAIPQPSMKVVAFSKCSRDKKPNQDECEAHNSELRNGYQNVKFKPKASDFASHRKSAAQKVKEGY